MTVYLLDTDVFIEAKNRRHGFDFCPAFRDWPIDRNRAGKVASVEKVAEEMRGEDDLAQWVKERGTDFFPRPDDAVSLSLGAVSDWASGAGYAPGAISAFLRAADYWLVAHASAHGCIVVTHEVPADSESKIKIPNACRGLGLACANPFEMLRRERASFVLEPAGESAR